MATTAAVKLVGEITRLTATFLAGTTPTNPTTVSATVRAPDGTVTTYTGGALVNDSTGVYHLDVLVDQEGDWWYQITGTGAVADTVQDTFYARPSFVTADGPMPNALTTLGAMREYVLRDATDGSQDYQLIRLGNAYSDAVYAYTRREWLPAIDGDARRFTFTGGGFLSLEPFELRNLTSITMYTDMPTADQRVLVAGTSTVQGEFRLHPPNKTAEGTYQWITLPQSAYGVSSFGSPAYYNNPYPYGPVGRTAPLDFEVTVVGDWGIGSVPADVELAVLIAVKDAYENPTGYATGTEGGLSFTEAPDAITGPEARARNLPIESRALLTPYKRGTQVVTA